MINRQGSPRLLLVNNLSPSQEIEKSLKCTSTIEPPMKFKSLQKEALKTSTKIMPKLILVTSSLV